MGSAVIRTLARSLIARGLAAFVVALLLAACASHPKLVWHSFSADGVFDGWAQTVDLLEYKYGDQFAMAQRQNEKGLGYRFGVNGPMPVAEFLYVKWRLKATGEVIEQRVDLRDRLPENMEGHYVTFVIDQRQLYVYVATPTEIKVNLPKPPLKTYLSRHTVTYEIYPNN